MECCTNCIAKGFCSHQESYFWNNSCSRAGLLCSIFKRCNTCNATEHLFLFTVYRIRFCDASFHYRAQHYPATDTKHCTVIEIKILYFQRRQIIKLIDQWMLHLHFKIVCLSLTCLCLMTCAVQLPGDSH